jgi:hypothetical protein
MRLTGAAKALATRDHVRGISGLSALPDRGATAREGGDALKASRTIKTAMTITEIAQTARTSPSACCPKCNQ